MKFSIARSDLESLLNAILPSRALFKADTLEISACAARVFVTWKGTVGGIESLVLEDGAVSLAAKAFREVIETYKGTHVLFFEGGPDGLRIQNLHMRVLGYDPSPKPPGQFQIFHTSAPPGTATHDTPREAEEETEQPTESAQEAPEELWLVNLNYDPLFIESIGKTALRAAVEILQESIADGKLAHDAIADAMNYLKTHVPAMNEDRARAFFDQFLQDLADLQLENDSEGPESPATSLPPVEAKPVAPDSLTLGTESAVAPLDLDALVREAKSLFLHSEGRMADENIRAFRLFHRAAEQGHAVAQCHVGIAYNFGIGVTQDHLEAVQWYRKAAEQGDAAAQNHLGMCCARGWGVTQNYLEAAKWYRKAAEQGHAYAQHHLAKCYERGEGVPQDFAEGFLWLFKAAKQGHADAQYNLGGCYLDGRGVREDYAEAAKWFRRAAEQGHAEAKLKLGEFNKCGFFAPQVGKPETATQPAPEVAEAAKPAEQLEPKTETLKTEPPQPATEAVPLEAGSAHRSRRRAMNDKFVIRGLYISWAFGLVMLGLAVSGKHPHNFYALLRWIVCAVFAFSTFAALRLKRPLWACVFAVQAVLFNPFAEFHFRRETWQTLDKFSIASVVLAALVEVLFRNTKLISKWREAFSPLTAVAAVAAIGSGTIACYLYAVHPSTLQPEATASESAPSPPVQHEPIPNVAVAAKTSAPNKQPQAPTESAEAEYQAGLKLLKGNTTSVSDKRASEHFKNAAEAGHSLAKARLAICYVLGIGVEINTTEGNRLAQESWQAVEAAAQNNNADAQRCLGYLYCEGIGIAKNYAEAMKWYRKAADLGDANAMRNIGTMYENGDGVAKDYAEALKWFHRAADLGDADATKEIGVISGYGEGGAKNYTEAMRWFQRAADLGNTEAMTNIGTMYENGDGVAKDYAEALKWFHRAADLGDADAVNGIGTMYWKGEGVAKDYAETMKWYRKAADLGSAEAMSNIGLMYKNGDGVAKDYAEVMKWYRSAADLGSTEAMKDIGAMYENGERVSKDYVEAMKWYRKAADLGDADAENSVNRLGSSLKMTATFHKVATSWYSWASIATLITVILVWRIARHRKENDW